MNAELANNLGNLCQRTLSQIAKKCEEQSAEAGYPRGRRPAQLLGKAGQALLVLVRGEFEKLQFSKAARSKKSCRSPMPPTCTLTRRRLDAEKDRILTRMATVLYRAVLAEVIRNLGIIMQPTLYAGGGEQDS